jgi:hypothetical protein
MKWHERPFFKTKGTILEHTIDIAFVALCARAATWIVKGVFAPGWFVDALELLDEFGTIVLFIWFFVQMFKRLGNISKEHKNGTHVFLVV